MAWNAVPKGHRQELVLRQALHVAVIVPLHFLERIASEFLPHLICEDDGEHCFADNACGWDGGDVGALESGVRWLFGVNVDGTEALAEGRDRLHVAADAQLL